MKTIKILSGTEQAIEFAGSKEVQKSGSELTIQPRVMVARMLLKPLVAELCDAATWVKDEEDCYIKTPIVYKGDLAEIDRNIQAILKGDEVSTEEAGDAIALSRVSFLTRTAKMGCYSFNLPAGPAEFGGACPASAPGFLYSGRYEGRTYTDFEEFIPNDNRPRSVTKRLWICNACYALKNNYQYSTTIAGQMVKFEIVKRMLSPKGWKGRNFASYMKETITAARKGLKEELRTTPAQILHHVPHPDYFRIHDSGDFFDERYWDQWVEVMEHFPEVNFWAPTRMWSLDKPLKYLKKGPRTNNLALRPSALHFGDPAPRVAGLAMGAASAPEGKAPKDSFQCPAYDQENLLGGVGRASVTIGRAPNKKIRQGFYYCKVGKDKWAAVAEDDLSSCVLDKHGRPTFKMEAGNCQRAHGPASPARHLPVVDQRDLPVSQGGMGCRACWDTTTPVVYKEH